MNIASGVIILKNTKTYIISDISAKNYQAENSLNDYKTWIENFTI